jgi:L-lactate dehydrogenase complex protein LldG
MSSKKEILKAIKKANLKEIYPLTTDPSPLTTFDDKIKAFKESLKKAGGEVLELKKEEIPKKIEELFGNDKKIISYVDDIKVSTIDKNKIKNPHDLKDIDIVIAKGDLAVSENGAIWCDDRDMDFRAAFFITKILILTVDKKDILNNMQEAYEKIDIAASNFGIFISGPSKTADIEQSLVIGAHGAIRHIVFIV